MQFKLDENLPPSAAELLRGLGHDVWFEEFLAEQWDRQIEADILAGRLEAAGRWRGGLRGRPLHPLSPREPLRYAGVLGSLRLTDRLDCG